MATLPAEGRPVRTTYVLKINGKQVVKPLLPGLALSKGLEVPVVLRSRGGRVPPQRASPQTRSLVLLLAPCARKKTTDSPSLWRCSLA